ncbi:MAG: conjugative transfer signal peptidase TraF [Mesorhizobium sp.]|nr:MAG: conjugative transfer signal peptidase TraF [Mesorhizobium sp.]
MSRRPAIVLVAIAASMVLLAGVAWLGGVRVNLTPSYPLGLWRIEPLERPAAVGDLVFICPPDTAAFRTARERVYLGRGLCPGWFSPLIKTVVATEGQAIAIGAGVSIDGRPLPHSNVRPRDAEGRALVPFAGGQVPAGFLFLYSGFAGSYDSRYFGPIPASGLLGRARPLLTFEP